MEGKRGDAGDTGGSNKMARERDGNKHLTDATKSARQTKINKNVSVYNLAFFYCFFKKIKRL